MLDVIQSMKTDHRVRYTRSVFAHYASRKVKSQRHLRLLKMVVKEKWRVLINDVGEYSLYEVEIKFGGRQVTWQRPKTT
jgi:hypothetical protein